MKYATIGTSWITESFISSSKTVKNMDLYAVYSRSEKKACEFAQKHGVAVYYTELSAMADDKNIEAVYIASPNVCHYEQSRFFIEHGKNVICEKPATTTKAQMEELYALAEKNSLIYTEAIMTVNTEGFRLISEKIDILGKIRSAHFDFYQLSSKYPLYINGENPNIFNPEMHTGCLMDIGVYNLYLAAGLFGMPEKIISDSIMLPNGCDAAGSSILCYKDKIVTLNYSKVGQTYSYSEIIGDNGTFMFSSVSQLSGLYFRHKDNTEMLITEEVSRDEIMSGEIRLFLELCESRDIYSEKYIFAKKTALTVREMCDIIRKNDGFLF